MVLNLHSCQTGSKEGSRHHRADERSAVSADHHRDCDMSRIHPKLIADSNQYRKKSEEIGIRTEQKGQRHGQDPDNQRKEPSHRHRDKGCQNIGHMHHNLGFFKDSQEHACCQDSRCHHESRARMGFDYLVLQLCTRIIDKQRNRTSNHKSIIRRYIQENQTILF